MTWHFPVGGGASLAATFATCQANVLDSLVAAIAFFVLKDISLVVIITFFLCCYYIVPLTLR